MKKITAFLFLLSLLISNTCFSQSGWFWQNPLPQGNELYSVKLIDANTAYACGYSGVIIKTTNQGLNWNTLKVDSGFISTSLFFHNANTGWISSCEDLYGSLGYISKVMKTTNGGVDWVVKYSTYGCWYYSIEFTSMNTGYILARGSQWGIIYKTIDGGENWNQIYSVSDKYFYDSYFFNNTTGYICGSSGIMKTTNGGTNWVTLLDGTSYPNIVLSSIVFPNLNTGYSVGYSWSYPYSTQAIYKTTNAGSNWIRQTGYGTASLKSVHFLNSNTGFAINQSIISTTNGGINWAPVSISEDIYGNSIDMNSAIGMAVGYKGLILITTNNGLNWINNFPSLRGFGYGINSIRFCNKYTGFAVTGNNILKTTNRGNNWLVLTTPVTRGLSDLAVVDSIIIYAVGGEPSSSEPVLIKTSNGGLNWLTQNSNLNHGIVSISFINPSTGYCMSWGEVSKTTDGGNQWIKISSIGGFSIFFVNANTGYISNYTYAYKTINGGNTWNSIPADGEEMFFLNPDTGFTVSIGMKIRKTTNGGMNWTVQAQSALTWRFYAIHFFNSMTGYAAGDFGAIAKTTNGGINWYYQMTPTNQRFASVYMTDTNECFVAGMNNTILKTTSGGEPFGIQSLNNEFPSSPSLSQNYPNPFNPVTKVKYDVPKSSFVKITIYDVLGREIETLVNQTQKPGSYEVTWNGSRFASGVYFYKLMTDEFVETKKMVLIK